MLYYKVGNIIACVYCMFTILRVQFGLVWWRYDFFLNVLNLIIQRVNTSVRPSNTNCPHYTLHNRGHAQTLVCYFLPTFSNCYDYEITYLKCTVVYTYFTLIKNIENKTFTCFLATILTRILQHPTHTIPCVRTPTTLHDDRHSNCVLCFLLTLININNKSFASFENAILLCEAAISLF